MALQFLQPGLLWGSLLLLVPLVIHLLNRRRYLRRSWAAMEFLLAAFKKVRRRVRLENLLLLLLRCAIPVLLALALARPIVGGGSPLAALSQAARHHVLLVDATLSNSQKPKVGPRPITRTRLLVEKYLRRLASKGEFQKVSLIRVDTSARLVLEGETRIARALDALPRLCKPGFGSATLLKGLELAREIGKDPAAKPVFTVFTDLQRSALGPEPKEAAAADPLALVTADLAELSGDPVVFVDTGPERPPANAGILSLEVSDPVVVKGLTLEVRARIRNWSGKAMPAVQVIFSLDGQRRPSDVVDLPPGGTAEAVSRFSILEKGPHWIRAALPGDALEGDDERWLALVARDRVKILFVDGRPDPDFLLSASGYMARILDPTGEEELPGVSLFRSTVVDSLDFAAGRVNLDAYDVAALVDVDRVPPAAAKDLADFVRSGGGLLAVPGGKTEPAAWNLRLTGPGAEGPLPVRLLEAKGFAGRGKDWYTPLLPKDVSHPVLRDFTGPLGILLSETPVYRFFGSLPARPSAQVLLRLSDPDRSPLLVADRYGRGKVLVLTSPITEDDRRWNELNAPILAFPLLYQSALWLTRSPRELLNLQVGRPLVPRFRKAPSEIHVTPPGGRPLLLRGTARPMPEGDFAWTPWTGVDTPGVYRLDFTWPEGDSTEEAPYLFAAACVDPAEGNLEKASPSSLAARLPRKTYRLERGLPQAEVRKEGKGGGDIGYNLLFGVLLFLVLEGILGDFFGRRRA